MSNLATLKIWHSKNIPQLVLKKKTLGGGQIESLDGLRGIAVIFVFLEHVTGNVFRSPISGDESGLNYWLNFGHAGMGISGVYLFFVLSSFLLTSQLLKKSIDLKNPKFWLKYTLKRVLRIYPLYILILLVYLIFPSFKYDITNFFKHLSLQQGLNHFWTIPVEVKYYFILPVVAWLFVKLFRRNLLLATLTCITLSIVSKIIVEAALLPGSRLSIFPHLPIFLLGSLAALVNTKISKLPQTKKQSIRYGMEIVAVISFIIILFSLRTVLSQTVWSWIFGSEIPEFPSNHWLYVIHGCLWSILLVSHLHGKGFVSKLLSYKFLRFIGIVSFGVYLWHIAVLGYLNTHLPTPNLIKFLAITAVTIIIATFTYITIESPFTRLRFGHLKGN